MNHYLVVIDLPDEQGDDFLSLIPRQRKHIDTLLNDGRIVHYALAADHKRLWTTILAESEEIVLETVRSFPVAAFIRFTVHELAFHLQAGRNLMHVSLN
jgi:hypothetical protein